MKWTIFTEKPHVLNLHMRIENKDALAAMPRQGSLLFRTARPLLASVFCLMSVAKLQAVSWTLSETLNSYEDERIEASQDGGESDTFTVEVPAGKKAVVHLYVSSVSSQNIGGRTVYLKWNGGSEQELSGQGASDSHTFTSNGSVTIGVRCSAGTHEVPHTRTTTIGGKTIESIYYTTEYWTYYQCAVTYDIDVRYESLLPDLTVSNLSFSAAEVPEGEEVTLSFTVKNDGGLPAEETSVARVYVDGVQAGDDLPVGALAAGMTEERTLSLPRQIAGEHAVRVDVDAADCIEEGNEKNNSSAATLVVYERTPYTVRFNPNGGTGTMADQPFVAGTAQALETNRFTNGDWQFAGWAASADGEPEYDDGQTLVALTHTSGAIVTLYAVWRHLWTIDENGVLTAVDLGKKRDVIIPDGVTSIGEKVFYSNTNLTHVVLPSSVTNIGEWAFRGCYSLTNVVLSSNLVSIGDDAFAWCRSLKHVEIPSSVKSIGINAFWSCDKLERAIVSEGVEAIGLNMFSSCESLSSISLPQSLKEIRVGAFGNCSFKDVTIPPSVTNIGGSAFSYCRNLTTIALPEGVKTIGGLAFRGCSCLSRIDLPEGIANIARGLFNGCLNLSVVDIPEGVTNIEMEAFSGCRSLKDVLIPSSVVRIGSGAFHECLALRRVVFAGEGAAPTIRQTVDGKKVTYLFGLSGKDYTARDCIVYVRRSSFGWDSAMVDYRTTRRYDYIVRFDANGGEMEGCVLPVDAAAAVGELPTPTRTGHAFLGWYTAANGGTQVHDSTLVESDVKYYAHWERNSCTVTFDANGGIGGETRTCFHGDNLGSLLTPEWADHTFDGWFTAKEGGEGVTADTVVTSNMTYYAHWTEISPDPITPNPVTSDPVTPAPVIPDPVTPSPVTPDPVTPETVVVKYGGVVEDAAFTKAQTKTGALYDATGNLVGTVELKFGKMGKKGVKVSASATMIIGGKVKKVGAKAATLADGELRKTLAFKAPIGDMELALNADGSFTLKNGVYEMVGAVKEGSKPLRQVGIGGALAKSQMAFNVEMDAVPDFGKDGTLLNEALPVDVPVYVAGGTKWSFGKVPSLKYAKDRTTGAYNLIGLDDPLKPNVSGLKLSYTAKTGQFKGTFKLYATTDGAKPKLKKFTVNVIGFVVDGVGYGEATLKKPFAAWSVRVE